MPRALAIDARLSFSSGIGTYLRHLLSGGVVSDLHCAVSVLDPPRGALPVAGAASLRRVPLSAPQFSLAEQWAVAREARGHDVLWVPHFNVPLRHPGRLVVTLHDIAGLDAPPEPRDWLWTAYGRLLLRHVARRAHVVLCDSVYTRDAFLDHTGSDAAGTRVVPLGVDERWFAAAGSSAPELDSGRPYLLYVGNIKRHKNVSGLLRAFASIRHEIPHDLVLIGRREGLRSRDRGAEPLAEALGERCRLLDPVDRPALERWLAGATALVLPSFFEGFGLPPLEAMACGRPVVVSRAGALPEVCGDAALYFDPQHVADLAARLLEIARDSALAAELGRLGRERARKFAWSSTIARTREALAEALEA